jgi:hypothetical protein
MCQHRYGGDRGKPEMQNDRKRPRVVVARRRLDGEYGGGDQATGDRQHAENRSRRQRGRYPCHGYAPAPPTARH